MSVASLSSYKISVPVSSDSRMTFCMWSISSCEGFELASIILIDPVMGDTGMSDVLMNTPSNGLTRGLYGIAAMFLNDFGSLMPNYILPSSLSMGISIVGLKAFLVELGRLWW